MSQLSSVSSQLSESGTSPAQPYTVSDYLCMVPDAAAGASHNPLLDFRIKRFHMENHTHGKWLGGGLGGTSGAMVVALAGTGSIALFGALVVGAIFCLLGGWGGGIIGKIMDNRKTRKEPVMGFPLLSPANSLGGTTVAVDNHCAVPESLEEAWHDFGELADAARDHIKSVESVNASRLWNSGKKDFNSARSTALTLVDMFEQGRDNLVRKLDVTVICYSRKLSHPDDLRLQPGDGESEEDSQLQDSMVSPHARRELLQSAMTELMLVLDEEAKHWAEENASQWELEARQCTLPDQERAILQIKPIVDAVVSCGLVRMKRTQNYLSQVHKEINAVLDHELTFEYAETLLKKVHG